ncbi:MAG: serine/threonine-protein kinase [Solirubrobacteraceae bacterium]
MLANGTILEGYRVDSVLGEGGMGTVYRATQLSLNRVVALKLLAAELSDDPGFRARFELEGRLQAGLDHQHIVTVYEAGRTEQGLFLAMRLIDGPTLKDLILGGQLDSRRALRILAQVAQALDEAHAAGLIHRDIKPQNILIGKGDHAYLCDFGLIKAPGDSGLTATGQFMGTIDYVAPEQIQGDPAARASDCYSLCTVLYECLTGQVPFARPNEAATLHAHLVEPPPRPSEARPDLPAAIDDVIASGMAKNPDERPSSASELIRLAQRALSAGGERPAPKTRITQPDARTFQSARAPATALSPTPEAELTGARPVLHVSQATRASASDTTAAARAAATAPTPTAAPDSAGAAVRPRGGSAAPIAVVLLLGVAAAAAGFLIGHSGKKSSHPQVLGSSAAAGHIQLRYPSSWQLSSAPTAGSAASGVPFDTPVTLTAPPPTAGTLTAGEISTATGPTLLPASLSAHVQGGLPASRPVGLRGLAAASYAGLRLAGQNGTTTVYAVPNTAGVATIVCSSASASFMADCGRVAATLGLMGASAFPLGANAAYARGLSGELSGLQRSVKAPLAALGSARTPAAQAAAADQLARVYTAVAAQLVRLSVSPRDRVAHDRVVAALRALSAGYAQAAAGARHTKAAAYARGGRQIAAASAALAAALQGLSTLGYKISSG